MCLRFRLVNARRPDKNGERGAAAVEFAFAMIILFFFFISFYQIVEIFLAHERLSYAAFVASRAHQVHGNAYRAALSVDSDFSIRTDNDSVTLTKSIPVPINFHNPFSGGAIRERGATFTISKKVPTFVEPRITFGDN
jgi:hypothetical protein